MNLVQLIGRQFRLKRELVEAYSALPWNTGRIERLTEELAANEQQTVAARTATARVARPSRSMAVTTSCGDDPSSTHAWLGTFAARLMQLCPTMGPGSAVRHAVRSIHDAAGLDPRRAAELLVTNQLDSRPVAVPRADHSTRYEVMFGRSGTPRSGRPVVVAADQPGQAQRACA